MKNKQRGSRLYAVDFFCGAGGVTRGLIEAGIRVKLGIDADEQCKKTYERNNPTARYLATDIRELRKKDLQRKLSRIKAKNLLFAACAPCQPFAPLNRLKDDKPEARLLREFGRFVKEFKPRFVLLENVPGIARVRGHSTLRRFKRLLEQLGYNYDDGVLDAKAFGVPQTRRRYVLIAARGLKPWLPQPTHGPSENGNFRGKKKGKKLKAFKTVRQAIAGFPALSAGETDSSLPNHWAAALTPINLERIRETPHDGGDRRSWPKHLVLKCHEGDDDGHTDVYGRLFWDKPSPTLTCRCHSLSNGRYGHPEQDRAISLREAAVLQSFPKYYRFYGVSKHHIAAQIGNAVPVRLAHALGRHILEMANGNGARRKSVDARSAANKKGPQRPS